MKKVSFLLAAVGLAATSHAQDGLVVCVDDVATDVMYYLNGGWHSLFRPSDDPWGLAADNATQTIYYNSGSALYSWTAGGGEVFIGNINDGSANLTMVSLAYNPNDGFLYSTRNIANEGVYRIDPSTGAATLENDYTDGDFDFGGLDIDPITGIMYGANDDSTPQRGLYKIGAGTPTFLTDYPAGETDLDGLAAYDNIVYLVSDEPGNFYMIDVNNLGAGYTAFANPWTTSEIFAGATVAAWLIPTPGTLGLLGLGLLAGTRRRR
ncbi:MAG: hypothetical protein D6695_09330 [Planctomycetota bacterium]|nr:MAG: hypothetical protein D6695_09330 [Planctomycetota bacterium]